MSANQFGSRFVITSFGESHGTVPFIQKELLAFDGVPPPNQVPMSLSRHLGHADDVMR